MKIGKYLSCYLTPAELPEPATITIERILEEEVDSDGTPELHLVLYAGLASKRIVLDKTGLRTLADLFGDETDNWLGKRVSVFNDTSVLNQGRRGKIRFRPVAGASGVPPPSLHRPGRLLSPCSLFRGRVSRRLGVPSVIIPATSSRDARLTSSMGRRVSARSTQLTR